MSRGRKPISNALKSLRGTDQKIRLRNEEKVETLTKVSVPAVLKSKRAKKIFRDKAKQLIERRILSVNDIEQLTIYSYSLDTVFECMENLEEGKFKALKDDKGRIYKFVENPYLPLYRQMVDIVNKIGSDFGFNPVSRSKVKASEPEQIENSLLEFL